MANKNPNTKGLKPVKPGERRNPNGRPKGSLDAKTIIRKYLEMVATETQINPKTKRKAVVMKKGPDGKPLTYFDAMVLAQVQKAVASKDTTAFNAVIDRLEGKPKQTTDVNIPEGGAIIFIGNKKVEDE